MHGRALARRLSILGPTFLAMTACSGDRGAIDPDRKTDPAESTAIGAEATGEARAPVTYGPRVEMAYPESSLELRALADRAHEGAREDEGEIEDDHKVHRRAVPRVQAQLSLLDPVVQSAAPMATMPASIVKFLAQGNTDDAATMSGTPPDTNGTVGPNDYVQVVNGAIAVWDKAGKVVKASTTLQSLWTGYTGTNAGNGCATNNDGDPVVVYDQLADRWFVTQFSLPNVNGQPNYQCVAVSKTNDPTKDYWLYDYKYQGLNDYGKFGIWPDAYYATFNLFGPSSGGNSEFCAYDRASMLNGLPAAQQCTDPANVFGALPVSLDGAIPPPRGTPGYFMQLSDTSSLDLYKYQIDWAKPANTKLVGPTNIKVASYSPMCGNSGTCVPQPSPGNQLDSLSDRLMFRLTYRNFGTHDALVVNHSVDVSGQGGGVRWYEIRSPGGTPTVYQQGTYAPNDGNWRWMGSIAQDQAEDFVIGFSIASSSKKPSIGWTGRLNGDALSQMPQGESVLDTGTGVETGTFKDGTTASRWGDYSNLTVDPTDDCTFWYTTELYNATGPTPRTWDTEIASVRFPTCAANDFGITASPGASQVAPGGKATYTITTAAAKGTAESIALNIQDLPTGVTAAFNPATVSAGASSTLTLTAAGSAPNAGPIAFLVIGKATSAVHAAKAEITVGSGGGVDAGTDSGSGGVDSGSGGGIDSGSGDDSGSTGNDSGSTGDDSGSTGDDSGSTPVDSGSGSDSGSTGGPKDAGTHPADSGSSGDASGGTGDNGGSGDSSGCGCRTAPSRTTPGMGLAGFGVLALLGWRRRRRSST